MQTMNVATKNDETIVFFLVKINQQGKTTNEMDSPTPIEVDDYDEPFSDI